jgi:predicted MFS family arabinose efflux permease
VLRSARPALNDSVPDAAPAPEETTPRRLPGFLAAFAFLDYRRLWIGAFLSSLGTWTQDVALAWLIHTRMGDPFYLGLRTFAAEAPLIAFMLVGGAMADRISRRFILLTSQVLQMTFAAVLGVLYATDRLGIGAILGAAFLTGLCQSQSAPTYQAVLTTVVPPLQIPNAVALNSLQFNLSRAIGPVIAGILLARGGTGLCFLVNVVSFLAVITALARIAIPPPSPGAAAQSLGESLRAGFRHVMDSPALSVFMLLGAAGSFLAYPLLTYLPVIAGDVLRTGAAGYSLLLSSFGAGAIVGAVATAQRGHVPGRGRLLLLAFVAYGTASLLAVTSRRQPLSMVLLFLAGFCLVCAFSMLNSLVQESAPPEMRGRVLGIYGFAFRGGMPLGSLVAGVAVRSLGAPVVLGTFSGLLVLLCGVLYARSRRLRAA